MCTFVFKTKLKTKSLHEYFCFQFTQKMKFEYFGTTYQALRASAKTTSAKSIVCAAPVRDQVQILACGLLQAQCQDENFLFDQSAQVLYNYCIDERETNVTIAEFFTDFQQEPITEFVESELSKIFQCTNHHTENFDLDVPF
jgi:hypothetical protein